MLFHAWLIIFTIPITLRSYYQIIIIQLSLLSLHRWFRIHTHHNMKLELHGKSHFQSITYGYSGYSYLYRCGICIRLYYDRFRGHILSCNTIHQWKEGKEYHLLIKNNESFYEKWKKVSIYSETNTICNDKKESMSNFHLRISMFSLDIVM